MRILQNIFLYKIRTLLFLQERKAKSWFSWYRSQVEFLRVVQHNWFLLCSGNFFYKGIYFRETVLWNQLMENYSTEPCLRETGFLRELASRELWKLIVALRELTTREVTSGIPKYVQSLCMKISKSKVKTNFCFG